MTNLERKRQILVDAILEDIKCGLLDDWTKTVLNGHFLDCDETRIDYELEVTGFVDE